MGVVVQTSNPLAPWRDRVISEVPNQPTIAEWLEENSVVFNGPTICLHNGQALLRERWGVVEIGGQDVVAFVELPQGNRGGSNILQVVLMLVVVVAAVYTGGAAAAAYGSAAGAIAQGAVMAIGTMLVSMLIPPQNSMSNLAANALGAPSPTYNLNAQGNTARLGGSIPVIYGRHRVYPDFAAQPYTEYRDNEQYLYMLFCIGQGEYDILDFKIEDSPVSSFDEISYTVYGLNQNVTAFPVRVDVSNEVAGQELENGTYVGHFFANAAGTTINRLGIDIVAPAGMYYAADDGGLQSRNATFQIEAALWNETTSTLGPFLVYLTETISGATNTAIRKSYSIALSAGRYAVRVKRISAKDTSARAGNSILWAAMRGYIPGSQNYGGVTTVAVIAKATNNLSQASSRRFNCLVQRKLKTWNPTTGWSSAGASRSIAWAIADVCKADYGLKARDAQVDLQGLFELDLLYQARETAFGANAGDYCDIVFDSKIGALEAMAQIAMCGRAIPIVQGSLIRVVRDTAQAIPTALFSARNIVKGSFNIRYILPNEQTADSVIVEWVDKDSLMPKETTAVLAGGTSANPARIKMQGVSSNAQAWREGITQAAANRFRRKVVSFQTELEGHIPTVGDLIAVSHPMPNWGVSGELLAAAGLDLTLSEPVVFASGTHYIALRRPDGSVAGPFVCTAKIGGTDHQVTLAAGTTLDFTLSLGDHQERTYFAFGVAGEMYMLARVLPPIRPRGANLVEITCTNENQAVHDAEGGTIPALPDPWTLPKKITKPVISRLDVSQGGTAESPVMLLSWSPAPSADHYLVQTSANNADWISHPETTSTSYSAKVEPGPVWVRVAGVGMARGDWATWNGTAGQIPPPGDVTGLASVEAFTGSRARVKWTAVQRATGYKVEVWAAGVLRRSSSQQATEYEYTAEDVVRDGGPWRALTFKVSASNGQGDSVNQAQITLTNPQVGLLSGINVYAGIKSAVITYTRPTDTDFAGVRVCMSQTAGFTPDDTNVEYQDNDAVITIPNLVEGNTYYFHLAGYDSFGTDGLTYSGEYSAAISSANLPTPAEIKQGLQDALDDPAATPLAFDADVFAVRLNGVDAPVFVIGNVNGSPAILLDANVGITGNLSASQIRSGRIDATENIIIGNGNAVINGDGSVIVYDGDDTLSNRDFAMLTGGTLTFQRYRDGAYHEYKSVRRVEYGQAASGSTVTLPGYWEAQPKLIVSPASLRSYDAAQSGSSQTWTIRGDNLHENPAASGIWQFDAVAELNYANSSGNSTVASASGALSTDTWTSGESTLPINTASITATAQFSSIKGDGVSTYGYYYRTVTWKIQGWNGTGWVDLATKSRAISAAEHGAQISDTQAATTTGYTKVRLSFSASNTDGTEYSRGANAYNSQQNTVASNAATATALVSHGSFPPDHNDTPRTLTGAAYSPPSGWEVYAVNYSCEWQHTCATINNSSRGYTNGNFADHTWTKTGSGTSQTAWAGVSTGDLAASSYNASFWQANVTAYGYATYYSASMALRNPTAIVKLRQLITNSAASANNFTFQSYAWNISGSSAIATGSLNWIATGD